MQKSTRKRLALLMTLLLMVTMSYAPAFAASSGIADVVIYNLGSQEVTVGLDGEESETYKLFAEDGSFTIPLEANAFFPYEVQFQVDDTTTVAFFETPKSTVKVGGHKFLVATTAGDTPGLEQLGVTIGGTYVAAKPTPKEFKPEPGFSLFSLLPLNETHLTLDLTGFTQEQLKSVNISTILSKLAAENYMSFAPADVIVWGYFKDANGTPLDDVYHVIDRNTPVDMNAPYEDDSYFDMEMIVGTGNQLDASNERYIVTVEVNGAPYLDVELYTKNGPNYDEMGYGDTYEDENGDDVEDFTIYLPSSSSLTSSYYLGLISYDYTNTKIYKGHFNTAAAAESAGTGVEISGRTLNQEWNDPGEHGYLERFTTPQAFTIVYKNSANILVKLQKITVKVATDEGLDPGGEAFVSPPQGLYYDKGTTRTSLSSSIGYKKIDNVAVRTFTISPEHLDQLNYHISFNYYNSNGVLANTAVDKAVIGHFDSLSSASSAPDIKSQLLVPYSDMALLGRGYVDDFSGAGVDFTIFAEGVVYKYTIVVVNGIPNNNSADVYFNVQGANGLADVYVMPPTADSYYIDGYQTLLVLDNVSLSNLRPTFPTGDGVRIFSGGTLQVSDTTAHNFASGPVQYTAVAPNGTNLKNYLVSFVKQESGAKLFVNGPHAREVFLDNRYDGHHDIFIANVGDADLTGLNVTLAGAQNVKLDDYWTVGGAGNSTLAAFSTVTSGSQYNDNVAKIRLVPDGEGVISGTLTITASGQTPFVIDLSGVAGNPKIITTDISGGVKYVPYSFLVQTNNMYSWNQVTFDLEAGTLPIGVVLRPNGEIYGVPKEAGTFPITVRAKFSSPEFTPSSADFTLEVTNNSDLNVDASTDAGYTITTRVPQTIYGNQDELFVTEGDISEFIDFWLDGDKLTASDYDAIPGSTKITIIDQTIRRYGSGTHTIAAEYRVGGSTNNDLKRAAQNYTLRLPGSTSGGGGGGGGVATPPTTPVTPPANTPPNPYGDRISYISGANRVLTAVAISQIGWDTADTVFLAAGANGNLIDSLAVAPLAFQENGPILFSVSDELDAAVIAEIRRLQAKNVTIIGALSQNVIAQVNQAFPTLNINILSGRDRFETMNMINAQIESPKGSFIIGYNALPDALSAASWAAANGYTIQIAQPDGSFSGSVVNGYILGGPGLVGDIPGFTRIFGADRYATNKALRETLPFETTNIFTADGDTLVDALAGSVLAAKTKSAIVIAPRNDAAVADFGSSLTAETNMFAFGGSK